MKYKKGIHLKTPLDSNYWHFPCVMLCTLPFVVQLQYILQYVKHLKCESGNNSTKQWQFWRQQQQNRCSLPASCLNMHNLSTRVFIECPRPEFGNTFQERLLASQKKCHNFNLTYLVHFNVLFYLWLLEALSRQFCNLCAHKLNGCHWNDHYYWGLKPFPVGGSTVEKVSNGIWVYLFFIFVIFLALKTRSV